MGSLYLITRENIPGNLTSFESHFDIATLGSYVAIKYGADYLHKTKEDAFTDLIAIARQPQNIHIGYTRYILDTNGTTIYVLQAVVNEYEISTKS